MFSECQQSGIAHIGDKEPNWRYFATAVDKENVDPVRHNTLAVPWTAMLDEDDSVTSATEAGGNYTNSGSKTPGGRRKDGRKLDRKPLGNITPLFERKVRGQGCIARCDHFERIHFCCQSIAKGCAVLSIAPCLQNAASAYTKPGSFVVEQFTVK